MTPTTALVFLRSLLRSIGHLLGGRIRFPRSRLGDVLELPDGSRFVCYRETALHPAADGDRTDGVVLVFRLRGVDGPSGETLRGVLFDPVANVATPFFAGMPGFRRKLWLAGTRGGEFLELYEWATVDDANRFVGVLRSLLAPFDSLGAASFEVVDDDTVDEYVSGRRLSWEERGDPRPSRERWARPAALGAVAVLSLVVGYLLWRVRSRADRSRPPPEG
ncbi:hypothetical protein [Haloplanus halophilus]|uniref:hypothetical protein n=1 Tax=Haloplanus halophilus TaxID=2949993 RepID=UPI00203AB444|nr:hypothetical protein [Haloplanus sp. GDY1]